MHLNRIVISLGKTLNSFAKLCFRDAKRLKEKRAADKAAAAADPILSAQLSAAKDARNAGDRERRALQSPDAASAKRKQKNVATKLRTAAAFVLTTALSDAAPRRLAASADTPKDSFVSTFQTNVIASKVCYRQTPTACFTLLTTPTLIALADIVLGANQQLVIRMGS